MLGIQDKVSRNVGDTHCAGNDDGGIMAPRGANLNGVALDQLLLGILSEMSNIIICFSS